MFLKFFIVLFYAKKCFFSLIQDEIQVSKMTGLNIFIKDNIFCMKMSIINVNEVFADSSTEIRLQAKIGIRHGGVAFQIHVGHMIQYGRN